VRVPDRIRPGALSTIHNYSKGTNVDSINWAVWGVAGCLGVMVGLAIIGSSLLGQRLGRVLEARKRDREMATPAPADVVDIPQQRDGNGA